MPEFRGHSEDEYRRREAERIAAEPLLLRCSFCEWSYQGTVGSGPEKATQHRLEAHPEVVVERRRRTRSLKRFRASELSEQDVAEIDAERQRRARLIGIELSGDTD